MAEKTFADLGRVEALNSLFEGTPYSPSAPNTFEAETRDTVMNSSRVLLEGIDFDLIYFPLKHLGYKSVLEVTGELYSTMAKPVTLSVNLGISSKLDYSQIKDLWSGMVAAAREHGYKSVSLDLVPSKNGLCISVSAVGTVSLLTAKRRPQPKSKDLLCVSGSLGAAFLGMQVLEREKRSFEKDGPSADRQKHLEAYKMLVGAYLKPELPANVISQMEDSQIYPSAGYFVTRGLADAVKRLSRDTGLGVKVYADKMPFEGNSFELGKELNIDPISAAMNGGDDCRLLFTVPILSLEKFRHDFQTFDIIGHLAQPEAGTVLVSLDGLEHPVTAPGWPSDEEQQ